MKYSKTYFVLPTTDYPPDELIRLGQLIIDPRLPHRPFSKPIADDTLKVHKPEKKSWSYDQTDAKGANAGVFAHVASLLDAKFSGQVSRDGGRSLTAAVLTTQYIEPDQAYVDKSLASDAAKTWLKDNKGLGKTLYMVTGVKIASAPGEATHNESRTLAVDGEAGFDPGSGGQVQVGGSAGVNHAAGITEKGVPAAPFVFAYRLRKIHVSWRSATGKMGQDLDGGDLYGVKPPAGSSGGGTGGASSAARMARNRKAAAAQIKPEELEINGVKLEAEDFGESLPATDIKFEGIVDEDDGGKCLVVVAPSSP